MSALSITEYGRLTSELYSGEGREDVLELYLAEWKDTSGPVLAGMCGTGDFLISFAERDADIDGVDASEHMLSVLKRRCDQKGLSPAVFQQLIQEVDLPRRYGFVFLPDRCFSLVTVRAEAVASLRALGEHMLDGGKLVLDVKQPRDVTDDGGIPSEWQQDRPDGSIMRATNQVDFEDGGKIWRVQTRMEVWKGNEIVEQEQFDYRERLYSEGEVRELLAEAGFIDITVKRAYDGEIPNEGDDLVFVSFKECR